MPRADYLREEAELNKARIQLNQDYREYNITLIDLKVTMGVNIASVINLTDQLNFEDIPGDLSIYLKKSAFLKLAICIITVTLITIQHTKIM